MFIKTLWDFKFYVLQFQYNCRLLHLQTTSHFSIVATCTRLEQSHYRLCIHPEVEGKERKGRKGKGSEDIKGEDGHCLNSTRILAYDSQKNSYSISFQKKGEFYLKYRCYMLPFLLLSPKVDGKSCKTSYMRTWHMTHLYFSGMITYEKQYRLYIQVLIQKPHLKNNVYILHWRICCFWYWFREKSLKQVVLINYYKIKRQI